jgi:hypothetical protein
MGTRFSGGRQWLPEAGNSSILAEGAFSPCEQRMSRARHDSRAGAAARGCDIRARLDPMTSDEDQTTGPSDETKRKFREALERKNKASKQREGEAHLDGGGGAQQTQGPADHKREFRRKSG